MFQASSNLQLVHTVCILITQQQAQLLFLLPPQIIIPCFKELRGQLPKIIAYLVTINLLNDYYQINQFIPYSIFIFGVSQILYLAMNSNIYMIRLSQQQRSYLEQLLPLGYSFQPSKIQKRGRKSKKVEKCTIKPNIKTVSNIVESLINKDEEQCKKLDFMDTMEADFPEQKPITNLTNQQKIQQKWKKQQETQKLYSEQKSIQKEGLIHFKDSQEYLGVIEKMKSYSGSWMFLQTLNSIKYQEIFQNQKETDANKYMENQISLLTIQNKAFSGKYQNNFEQFKSNVTQMIKNGYNLLKNDKQLTLKIKKFQKHCLKLLTKLSKQKKTADTRAFKRPQDVSLMQKTKLQKQLAILQPQYSESIRKIIFGPKKSKFIKNVEIDINNLSQRKFRALEKFAAIKLLQKKCKKYVNLAQQFTQNLSQDIESSQIIPECSQSSSQQ